jgi:Domain of unknown function (DUF4440)
MSATLAILLAAAAAVATPNEASLRAADAEQMRIIVEGDAAAQRAFMHPNYLINAPANVVRRKADVVAILERGGAASERFERVIEGVALTGNVGIVAGHEIVKPTPTSNLGKAYPGQTLARRFTNVFLWEDGKWRFLARQATVMPARQGIGR